MSLSSGPKKEPALTNMGMRHDLIYKLCGPLSRFPRWLSGKEFAGQPGEVGDCLILGQEDPLEEEVETHSSILAGKSHGQRSL